MKAALLGTLRMLRAMRKHVAPGGEFSKILILQLQNLGDTLVFIPALRALREGLPKAELHLLASPIAAEVYADCPLVNRIWTRPEPQASWREGWRLLRTLRRQRYDCVLLDANHLAFAYQAAAAFLGARHTIGFDWDGRGALSTSRLPIPESGSKIDANLELVRALGVSTAPRRMEYWISQDTSAEARALLKRHGVSEGGRLICLHPGSNWPSKQWFPERFAQLARLLRARHVAQIAVTGTAAEGALAEQIVRDSGPACFSLAGETSLAVLAAVFRRAALVIAVDSGPRHLAEAVGAPLVILLSAQDDARLWSPADPGCVVLRYNPPCSPCRLPVCPLPGHDCMASISVVEVESAAIRVLQPAGTRDEDAR